MLNKKGHSFKTKQKQKKFNSRRSILMIKRMDYKMPSTTNNIESNHGHLNEMTPRNNTFLGSLHRLILSISSQLHKFNRNMTRNYR